MIVVIGPDWVATADESGGRRLHNPDDLSCVEVSAAFERGDVRVIPVLVGGAPPPEKGDLPPDLAPLTRRQALEVTDGRWDYDLGVLVKTITRVFDAPEPPAREVEPTAEPAAEQEPPPKRSASRRGRSWIPIAAGVVALLGVIVAVVLISSGGDDDGTTSDSAAIPRTNPCQRKQNGWLVTGLGAQAHYECDLETSPPPAGLESSTLVYGVFASAAKARRQFDEGLQFEEDEGVSSCPQKTLRRMREILPSGDSTYFVHNERKYLAIWWNADGSRVLGVVDFDRTIKPQTAVQAWERVLSAG